MGLFGTKIACTQCDKKVKESQTVARRQLRFCSAKCADQFAVEHPIVPAPGQDPNQHKLEAQNRLIVAASELFSATGQHDRMGAAASWSRQFGNTTVSVNLGLGVGAALAAQDREEARAALYRAGAMLLEVLPFLYALGLGQTEGCKFLESIDIDRWVALDEPPSARELQPLTDELERMAKAL